MISTVTNGSQWTLVFKYIPQHLYIIFWGQTPNFDSLSVAYILFLKLNSVVIFKLRPLSANRKTHLGPSLHTCCTILTVKRAVNLSLCNQTRIHLSRNANDKKEQRTTQKGEYIKNIIIILQILLHYLGLTILQKKEKTTNGMMD